MHRIILALILAGTLRAAMLVEVPHTSYSPLTAAGDAIEVHPVSLLVTNGASFVPVALNVEFTFGNTLDPRPENTISLSFPISFDGQMVPFPATAFFGPDASGAQLQGALTLRNGLGSVVALAKPGETVEVTGTILVPLPEPSTGTLAGGALLLLATGIVRGSRLARRR